MADFYVDPNGTVRRNLNRNRSRGPVRTGVIEASTGSPTHDPSEHGPSPPGSLVDRILLPLGVLVYLGAPGLAAAVMFGILSLILSVVVPDSRPTKMQQDYFGARVVAPASRPPAWPSIRGGRFGN